MLNLPVTQGLLMASLLVWPALTGVARAQEGDMFPTKAGAEQRARTLKCSGVFPMGDQWMPCKDFNAYQKATKTER